MGFYVEVTGNIKIYVEDLNPQGEKTIVFLHGWPADHTLFEYQYDKLPTLGYRCVGLDTRGFGNSDKPCTGYDYDTLSDDVREVVGTLGLRDFTLLGHSTGGAIAARYMNRHKGYGVNRLILVAAAVPSLVRRPNYPYGVEKSSIQQTIASTYADRPQMLRDFCARFFYRYISPAFGDWFLQIGLKAAGWATAAVAQTWINEVLFEDLESINIPTLIIQGIHDKIVPYELADEQHKLIRNSRLATFEFSGHGVFYDQKDEFNEIVSRFIENKLY